MSELIICNNKTICIQKTLTFGSRMENSHRNINTMFHATSTAEHNETIIATSILVYCNMCQASDNKQTWDVSAVALP